MTLLTLIITIAVVGLILWLVTTYIPMNDTVKRVLVAVTVIILVVWLLQGFGILGQMDTVRIGHGR